ncbi:probable inactive purple acid phosphatase 29 [Elaeis guineensis]|uniref:Probable inactive purple acid phosphatase 29 n=2 Tax=Elaeis guineensis var. tenera TaxID=51953 RepID=A0A6I9RY35_ELAGV|nr:probable inactive purple acid phosphatase 29 [Elaeis guineensis]
MNYNRIIVARRLLRNPPQAERQLKMASPKHPLLLLLPLFLSIIAISVECFEEEGRSTLSKRGRIGGGEAGSPAAVNGVLRFKGTKGEFKILQVADMHYADGRSTPCLDVFPAQMPTCSDLNTTAFINRVIQAENPDLVVFTGDNIFGYDSTDSAKSLDMAYAPVVERKLPWAAVLGNHDQEGTLSREGVMQHIVGMPHTLSRLNPDGVVIDGFGNYNLEVGGVEGSALANKSVLNLYFIDSGDYSTVPSIPGYGWIKPSQQLWFQKTSSHLQKGYTSRPEAQKQPAPGLVYFHIPLPEYSSFDASNLTGVKQEGISSASINSGFFATMVEAGDVKAVFTGHDHLNDFCGELTGIQLCYAGGFGYHAYGKAGWSRRARVVSAYLEKTVEGEWEGVKSIKTWKRLDDQYLSTTDTQVLWNKGSTGRRRKRTTGV